MASLDALPGQQGLTRAPVAIDQIALEAAMRDEDVRRQTKTRADIARLWEVCQIPDYRKLSPAAHADLILSVFRFVVRAGKIPDDWFSRQLAGLERVDGDIDALSARIAQVRTWTFIANRSDWLNDPAHWQGVARRVEDSLSDALHQRLAQRFVDRRTSVLMKRLRENAMLEAEITTAGDVMVEGQHVGQLHGFRFTADPQADGEAAKALNAAAQKALASEMEQRATRVSEAVDDAFVLANDGVIRWLGEAVGKIAPGDHILQPRPRVLADEQLTGAALDLVQRRLDLWLAQHVTKLLGPLAELEKGEGLEGVARGLAFQIAESLGVLERSRVTEEMKALEQTARAGLRQFGVRFGAYHLYLPALLKPAPRALAAQLWALKQGGLEELKGLEEVPHLAASGRTSFVADPAVPKGFYRAAGFRVCGERAVRVDILERLADLIRPAIAYRPGQTAGDPPAGAADGDTFVVTVAMTSLAGCSGDSFASILRSLGYQMDKRKGPAITAPLVAKAATEPAKPVAEAAPEGADDAAPTAEDAQPAEAATAEATEAAAEQTPVDEATAEAGSAETAPEVAQQVEGAAPQDTDPAPTQPEAAAEGEAPAVVEETEIEVWRPHRHHGGPRRHHGGNERGNERAPNRGPRRDAASTQAATPEGGEPRRDQRRFARPPRPDGEGRPEGGKPRFEGKPRFDDKPRDGKPRDGKPRFEGKPRFDGKRPPREDRNGGANRSFASSEKPRNREPDPNSPFAKLAALKAEMEKAKK
jgi:ATP-dependent RNA helicase SUPV3L1/SUV3